MEKFITDNRDLAISFYRQMLFYRRYEERVQVAYTKGKFSGFCHLHIGQEAVCVGVQSVLRDSDYVISSYRSHTQAIAKGIPAEEVMAELFGKATGCCRGKGGSMHMFSAKHRFYGGHGIVGGQVPLATGIAFKINYDNDNDVVICYLGDAAINQGQVMEAMNMAVIWKLPVLFIIENNRYGMGTAIERTTAINHLAERAKGFAMVSAQVDGMDVVTVHQTCKQLIENMRNDRQPCLLEALTYRYKGHSVSDPATYRSKQELQQQQQNDPLTKLGDTLLALKIISPADLETMTADIKREMKEIEASADQAPELPIEAIYEDIYVPQSWIVFKSNRLMIIRKGWELYNLNRFKTFIVG